MIEKTTGNIKISQGMEGTEYFSTPADSPEMHLHAHVVNRKHMYTMHGGSRTMMFHALNCFVTFWLREALSPKCFKEPLTTGRKA